MKLTEYKIDFLTYTSNDRVKSDCADITFANTGTTNITINGSLVISPFQSLTLTANKDEIDRTIYSFFFSGAGTNKLVVFRKIYI